MSEAFAGLNQQYYKDIEEELATVDRTISGASVASFEEYKRLVGRRQGLVWCLERHKKLIALLKER